MNKVFQDLYKIATLMVVLVLDLEGNGTTEEEKQEVVDKTMAVINEEGGLDISDWMKSVLPVVLKVLVGFVVKRVQESDFLKK